MFILYQNKLYTNYISGLGMRYKVMTIHIKIKILIFSESERQKLISKLAILNTKINIKSLRKSGKYS